MKPNFHPEQQAMLDAILREAKKHAITASFIAKHTQACVDLLTEPASGPLAIGSTRIGGNPDLPAATPWPEGSDGPMVFVAQVRLEDVAPYDAVGKLPKAGLLSFFLSDFAAGTVLWTADAQSVRRRTTPERCVLAGDERKPFASCTVKLAGAISLEPVDVYVAPEGWGALGAVARRSGEERVIHRVLGFELDSTEGEIDDEMAILLSLGADNHAGMEWGDAGTMYFCLDRSALAKRNFSKTRVTHTA